MTLKIKKLNDKAIIPTRGSEYSAGLDLYSLNNYTIKAHSKVLIPIGWSMEIPKGYYGKISSRSGLACKNDIEVGAGTIDSDYRGEICILLRNLSNTDYEVKNGDKIAQLIIQSILLIEVKVVDNLEETKREIKEDLDLQGNNEFYIFNIDIK